MLFLRRLLLKEGLWLPNRLLERGGRAVGSRVSEERVAREGIVSKNRVLIGRSEDNLATPVINRGGRKIYDARRIRGRETESSRLVGGLVLSAVGMFPCQGAEEGGTAKKKRKLKRRG